MKDNDMIVCDRCKKLDMPATNVILSINHDRRMTNKGTLQAITLQPGNRPQLDLCDKCREEFVGAVLVLMGQFGARDGDPNARY